MKSFAPKPVWSEEIATEFEKLVPQTHIQKNWHFFGKKISDQIREELKKNEMTPQLKHLLVRFLLAKSNLNYDPKNP